MSSRNFHDRSNLLQYSTEHPPDGTSSCNCNGKAAEEAAQGVVRAELQTKMDMQLKGQLQRIVAEHLQGQL